MKAKKKINRKSIIIIGIIFAGLVSILIYQTYTLFKTNKQINSINATVDPSSNFKLAVFLDGEKTTSFPAKESGYSFDKIECTDSGTAQWDSENWKLSVDNITKATTCNVYFKDEYLCVDNPGTLRCKILADNELNSGNPNFNNPATISDTGLWSYPEESGTSYYFRGIKNSLNNNVIFGGQQWKILRIDHNGNIKLLHNGTCPGNNCTINATYTATSVRYMPESYNFMSYVIPTGGTPLNSSIKSATESWYSYSLASYDSYIADVVYCQDNNSGVSYPNDNDTSHYYNATYNRLYPTGSYSKVTPTLNCPAGGKYTKSTAIGNGYLHQKVGHITIDEVALAGYRYNVASNDIFINGNYWTMSAAYSTKSTDFIWTYNMWYVSNTSLYWYYVSGTMGYRPVIALNANVLSGTGNGSTTSPYVVTTN